MILIPDDNDDTFAGTFKLSVPAPAVDYTQEQSAELIKEVVQAKKQPLPEAEPAPEPLPEIGLIEE